MIFSCENDSIMAKRFRNCFLSKMAVIMEIMNILPMAAAQIQEEPYMKNRY